MEINFDFNMLLSCVLTVLTFLVIIISDNINGKKDKTDKAFNDCYQDIPLFIRDCEARNINGSQNKLYYVLDLCCAFLSPRLKLTKEKIVEKYGSLLVVKIEDVLNTPQSHKTKEEVLNEKAHEAI